ncbi:ABC transporter ATP-binding protein [Bosea lathyri]|uniref:Glutathione import ATP-binding protein GsiA n=1 Tax=Bosea lathyri TaxID=1036778 RepID=A0A1H5W6R6_9HYPH|nr:ABC transporter ATP-binding protein [Bosea lathyri]SEF94861.1 peptide/nickel transport system ATP-binding protein [Bosea lathyri]
MNDQPSPVLRVDGLKIGFGRFDAVKGISFDVNAGETVALVGESGSGKSVTALSIMRLLPETTTISGRISLSGTDMLALRGDALRGARGRLAGMIFQEPMTSLNPVLKTGFQVAEALRYHGNVSQKAAETEALRLFDRVRIPDAKRRFAEYPHTLSGGMRQRVMIAMALACRPKLLIADEPTTALDVTIQAQILQLLTELQRESGTAILFITHDMGVVAEIADRVAVMRHGELVEDGTTRSLFEAPRHDYTKALLAAVPRLGDMRGSTSPRRFAQAHAAEPVPVSEPTGSQPLLAVENLVTRFPIKAGFFGRKTGAVHAVEDVSFAVAAGETLALVGESGCGKSTTGKSLLRLVEPQSGRVTLEGVDLLASDPAVLRLARRRMQMIFQDPYGSLDPRQTIGSAIAEPIRVHGIAAGSEVDDRVATLLKRVGLDASRMARFPHEFSGGQRQRIAIARALALDPRLVIADEAVSALDVSIKAQVVDLMIDLQEAFGLSYLFISHDMAVVERVSHRIAVMYLGRIVEIGPRAAVIENPQHPYTRRLLAAVPVADPRARGRFEGVGAADELKSPIRPPGYEPPPQHFRMVTEGHLVAQEA